MNILYCGDANIIDGLVISILSILKNYDKQLNIYILTMKYKNSVKEYQSISKSTISKLDKLVKNKNKKSFVKLIDITDLVMDFLPEANLDTRFTPYCMLRLYADLVPILPSKIMYLDNDVVCLKEPETFYNIDNSNYELVGVLDYYGSHFFKKAVRRKDYLNSGVLLLNLDLIRDTNLFLKARKKCRYVKMLMPDQTALNLLSKHKLIVDRIYNEQKSLDENTVFRHFSTTFKFWPTVHTQTIKPWNIDLIHNTLNIHEFDDVLEEYLKIIGGIKNEK